MTSDRSKKDFWTINNWADFWRYVELFKPEIQILHQSAKMILCRIRDQKTDTEYVYNYVTAYDLKEIEKLKKEWEI